MRGEYNDKNNVVVDVEVVPETQLMKNEYEKRSESQCILKMKQRSDSQPM